MPTTPTTPTDLIPAREAASLLDRSLSTIRAWVREGHVTPYRGPSSHPESAPLLVSRAEVLHYAAVIARIAVVPGRPPSLPRLSDEPPAAPGPPSPAPELVEALLSAHRGQVAALEARIDATEARLRDWMDRATRAEAALAALEERERATRAELVAATAPGGWWSRLLGTSRPS